MPITLHNIFYSPLPYLSSEPNLSYSIQVIFYLSKFSLSQGCILTHKDTSGDQVEANDSLWVKSV